MRGTLLEKTSIIALIFTFLCVGRIFAQDTQNQPTKVNFGQSRNPKTKPKQENTQTQAQENTAQTNQTVSSANEIQTNSDTQTNIDFESRSVANKTLEVVKRANTEAIAPTEIYKVGINDVLFISLQNAPSNASNYFTVLNDGTIDYPLAGEMVAVTGMTVEEIEDLLKGKIKLYENPQVSVKLREYASHSITVLGLVEKAGQKFLQREAIPLYVVRAEAVVQSRADRVIIKRADSTTEKFDLRESKYENILVFAGDIIEFTAADAQAVGNSNAPQFLYIGGNISSSGQRNFTTGMTLTQAILASGGLRKAGAKKVIVRRKSEQGLLVATEYNLKDIKDGKSPDPILQPGDTVEIEN